MLSERLKMLLMPRLRRPKNAGEALTYALIRVCSKCVADGRAAAAVAV